MDIGIGSIVDAGRQSHGALQQGEARATFETPSKGAPVPRRGSLRGRKVPLLVVRWEMGW